ncbi:NB-ARC domain-containing disease resistance protein, partial [Prunus dulcis]
MAEFVELVASLIGCLQKSTCLGTPLEEKYKYFAKRKEYLETLKNDMALLKSRRCEVERESEEKVVSKPYKISDWLERSNDFITETNELNFEDTISGNWCGFPNYYRSQYKAGKSILGRIEKVNLLKEEGTDLFNVEEDFVVGYIQKNTKELVGKTASAFEKIMKCVSEKEVGIICVYGMSGSGKTEVLKEVNNQILKQYKSCTSEDGRDGNITAQFEKVIWLTVENIGPPEAAIAALQKGIQKNYNLTTTVLGTEQTSWTELSLEHIGIPWQTNNGSKVIIVSKSRPVCRDITFDREVEIELGSDEEALKLFEVEAGIGFSALREDTRAAAENMVRECDGLPVAIAGLAQTLKEIIKLDPSDVDVDVDAEWNGAFYKLRNSSVLLEKKNRKAFARLLYSYSMLKKEAQQCFLYCALYPPGHCIEKKELVEHWFWEGQLIEDTTYAREILDEIKGAYLLEAVSEGGKECIKMRNLVRHMAIHLTKTIPDYDQFLIEAGVKLTDCPLIGRNLSKVERASLMKSQLKALTKKPKFYKLSTLLLQHNPISHFDDDFFRNMPNLKVLNLSHTNISTLPKSASSYLTKLRALVLRGCCNLTSLPSLANSEELLVLDLSHTPITELPDGMKKLTKLIRLDLSCTNVGEFQAELVRELKNLEELYLITNDSAGSLWGSEKEASSLWGSEKAASCIQELGALQHLAILHINFLDAKAFNTYVDSKDHSLSKFKFSVGGSWDKTKLPENSIVFIKSDFLVSGKPVSLPEDTSELHVIHISDCENLGYLFRIGMDSCQYTSGQKKIYSTCFPNLQEVFITRRWRMKMDKESKEPNPAVHPRPTDLVLVDPLELKKYYDFEKKDNPEEHIWYFPDLKMQIITSLPEELLPRPRLYREASSQYRSCGGVVDGGASSGGGDR